MREGYKITELGEIPVEWEINSLQDISWKIGDGLHGTPKYSESGDYYFINGNNLSNGNIIFSNETKKVDMEQFLKYKKELTNSTVFISLNGTIGNLAYYNSEKIVLGKSCGYAKLKSIVNKNYIFHTLNNKKVQQYFYKELTGSTIKNLSLETLRKTPIAIPPIYEQQKIADILSTVDSRIEQTVSLIEKTKKLKKGLMLSLLTKGIGHTEFKETEVGVIPMKWEVKQLKDLSNIKRGASPRPIKDTKWFSQDKNVGWIRISDVSRTKKYLSETQQYLSNDGIEKSRLVKKDDLIMSICATVGKPIILKMEACIHDGFVHFSELNNERLNVEFLYYFLVNHEDSFKRKGQTGTQANINTSIVGLTEIPLPNISEQKRIAVILASVDEKIDEYELKKEKIQQLKQGLMQKLLTGKIRTI
ncbi:restriction endonuclease subunit S [Clostridium sp.]|uniref:restriction endonuclease subunit S n=1 Tax=Clostridium sp. TaxID=1506 RepID=UPI003D6CBD5D